MFDENPLPPGAVLNAADIRRLIASDRPLVSGFVNMDRQIQPNGIDLTLETIWRLTDHGRIGVEDAERRLAARADVAMDDAEYYELAPGPYLARLREVVDLPNDLMALGKSRSSLLRCGVALHNAVWDAGYAGRSEVLLVVYNPHGFKIRRYARFLQLIFLRLAGPTSPYSGAYQGEHILTE